ncbi:signal transduction histidine kinase [Streptosporangium album]|uniref:histidine kinase n=1 Tax=Streptosporangium album TaxID=47479 RepID=A0A7W7WBK1_9ACTN|nr:HAMP domain-containing sensor histidine kinase [Streptosporangium album]MBB4940289.1 signal transduction histidine kinase [Streptosporangium album]
MPVPRMRSIRARYTTVVAALLLVILTTAGVGFDLAIRYKLQDDIFGDVEPVASQWSAVARSGSVPHVIPTSANVGLVQVVDARGRVVDSSRQAEGRPSMSTVRPPADNRFQRLAECSAQGGCVMIAAIRVSPAPDAPVVYAGMAEPHILRMHNLEYILSASVLLLLVLGTWMTWGVVGRMLCPVAAIRARMAEITVSDLSLRVPTPPGEDEIALLARTANQTLARLEGAVEQQRRFASTTSHELRTPIAGLRAQLEEALLYPGDVDLRETVRGALSTTGRLQAIVDDLLQLARLRAADPAPPEPIDLGALVRQEAAQPGGVPVDVQAASGVQVQGSRIQLIRVIGNLLSNARRHADTAVRVRVESVGGQAVVAVVDDGAGIAPADRERVFERFTRLADGRRRDAGGSGLGLAISRDIANAHHGTLRVEDSPRGARFVLRLPLSGAEHVGAEHVDTEPAVTERPVSCSRETAGWRLFWNKADPGGPIRKAIRLRRFWASSRNGRSGGCRP